MDEQFNKLMAYVLDEPEEAARELQDLRYRWKVDMMIVGTVFLIGVLVGAVAF
jgi:hypothetical protein